MGINSPSPWTPEKIEELKSLHAAGYSSGMIAEKMGIPTRNAIIGKLHRLGIIGNHDGVAKQPTHRKRAGGGDNGVLRRIRTKQTKAPKLRPQIVYPVRYANIVPIETPLIDLTLNQCRWVLDKRDGPIALCCGRESYAGTSWCWEHYCITHREFECIAEAA